MTDHNLNGSISAKELWKIWTFTISMTLNVMLSQHNLTCFGGLVATINVNFPVWIIPQKSKHNAVEALIRHLDNMNVHVATNETSWIMNAHVTVCYAPEAWNSSIKEFS